MGRGWRCWFWSWGPFGFEVDPRAGRTPWDLGRDVVGKRMWGVVMGMGRAWGMVRLLAGMMRTWGDMVSVVVEVRSNVVVVVMGRGISCWVDGVVEGEEFRSTDSC